MNSNIVQLRRLSVDANRQKRFSARIVFFDNAWISFIRPFIAISSPWLMNASYICSKPLQFHAEQWMEECRKKRSFYAIVGQFKCGRSWNLNKHGIKKQLHIHVESKI